MSDTSTQPVQQRRVRSFVRREGRLTDAQQRALETLLERFSLATTEGPIDPMANFARHAPLTIEIGFGNGEALSAMAANQPEHDFIGIEVHRPGVGRLLNQLDEQELNNVRIVMGDAVEFLKRHIATASVSRFNVYFPDPWPKKRHHKRRIIQDEFLTLLADRLLVGGLLHLATDWEDYAEHMLATLERSKAFQNLASHGRYAERPAERPLTRFEQRGLRLGHCVRDLMFTRC
ncbi:MAG: tRNA (guanosine(46)-N7)-methyltransferase TrmB [Pseudomonadota bacterium]|nr:tRNA (guanosine(46)-N7)-methyltransferase TrmB [Pseudomonadota bacterium]